MIETCHPVTTKRLVIGQVSVCIGCCCGQTDRGKPPVPVEWLKVEWRQRGLLKNIQLTISGCLGPCDVPNVVLIAMAEENVWLGNIDRFEYYREIVEWAAQSKAAGGALAVFAGNLNERWADIYSMPACALLMLFGLLALQEEWRFHGGAAEFARWLLPWWVADLQR
jgi:hypothetical protein